MSHEWKPAQSDIDIATALLARALPRTQALAGYRPEKRDLYALIALSGVIKHCLPVLPPDVSALARQHWQAVQDAYRIEEEHSFQAPDKDG